MSESRASSTKQVRVVSESKFWSNTQEGKRQEPIESLEDEILGRRKTTSVQRSRPPRPRESEEVSQRSGRTENITDEEEFEKLLKLSEEAKEALKKVQRFDRFIYAKEAEKACKDTITEELKKIEKIKNRNKEMRTKNFDNELTITALYNMLRLLNEMRSDF